MSHRTFQIPVAHLLTHLSSLGECYLAPRSLHGPHVLLISPLSSILSGVLVPRCAGEGRERKVAIGREGRDMEGYGRRVGKEKERGMEREIGGGRKYVSRWGWIEGQTKGK